MWPKQKMLDNDVIKFMNDYSFTQFLRDKQFGVQYNSIFVNDAVTGCDFPTFAEYYRMMLQKLYLQEFRSNA